MIQSSLHARFIPCPDPCREPCRLLSSHAHDGAISAPQIGLPGDASLLPDGRFLRAFLRRRREGRAPARHHADAARQLGRCAGGHGGRAVPRGRYLPGAAHQAGRIGSDLRADRRGRCDQGAGRAQGDAGGHPRHVDRCRVTQRQERVDAARGARRHAQRVRAGLAQRDGCGVASCGVRGRRARKLDRAHRTERVDLQRRSDDDL